MFLILSTIILAIIYFIVKYLLNYIYSYWHRKPGKIPYIKPNIPYGNLKYIGNHEQLGLLLNRLYKQLKGKGPIGGIYILYRPFAIALSTDFIKNMLVRDFNHFEDRGLYYNEKTDPISAHLINVNADKWHTLRRVLTPNFTTGKMKYMFPIVVNVSKQLESYLFNLIPNDCDNGKIVEIRSLLNNFTIDVISACAFGIDSNSLTNPDNEFRKMGIKSFEKRKIPIVLSILLASHQTIAKKLGLKLFAKDVSDFFIKIVSETIENRRHATGVSRNDFLDLVLKLKKSDGTSMLTHMEIVAQSFVFFIAAFDTSATTLTYALLEMARNPDIQIRLRNEIKQVIKKKYNGEFTYDAMLDLPYLDQVIYEVLRKHPPVGQIMRRVTKDYQVPDTKIVLPKGLTVFVPLYAIHHDPDIYPNPEIFDPERFSTDQLGQRQNPKDLSFLAFGHGPRNCFGILFGMMQTRIGLLTILMNYKIETCKETPEVIEYSKNNIMMVPQAGVDLRFVKYID